MDTIFNKHDPIRVLTRLIKKEIKRTLTKERYKHSVRVAKMCRVLCKLYDIDEARGYFCGISHDLCKGMDRTKLLTIAALDGAEITPFEKAKPDLLHGRAAAIILQTKYGEHDHDILEAVSYHTFGKAGMSDLAKILFIADKIEPGRPYITKKYLKKIFAMSLNEATAYVLRENINYVKSKNYIVAPQSDEFLQSLEK